MALASLIDQFVALINGPQLIEGRLIKIITQALFGSRSGIIANAGGGQANATPLSYGFNNVTTVANANDSVMLPPAIPGTSVRVNNATANSMQVFGVPSNINNGGAGDTIAVMGSNAQVATATGVPHASGLIISYDCLALGQWKQGAIS